MLVRRRRLLGDSRCVIFEIAKWLHIQPCPGVISKTILGDLKMGKEHERQSLACHIPGSRGRWAGSGQSPQAP